MKKNFKKSFFSLFPVIYISINIYFLFINFKFVIV